MNMISFILVLGINLSLWTIIGGFRLASEKLRARHQPSDDRPAEPRPTLTSADVAVLIPAHNEEAVIEQTIRSAMRLVSVTHIFVVADGCTDATAKTARAIGVNVVELDPGLGKAGGIEATLRRFDLAVRFEAVLIVDADTVLDPHYLRRGLPLLDRPGVVALAGYAKSGWYPAALTPVGRVLVSYRARLYAVMQWLKYGQTWRWTNVTAIVPGFASMYRTSVLAHMDLNPPGLIIEDFNMTFEIHRKRLGKIAFRPAVFATTQDPDNLRDYYRQVCRWHLGFWQTLRRHGLWLSGFSAALLLFLAETLIAAIGIALLIVVTVLTVPAAAVLYGFDLAGWIDGWELAAGLAQVLAAILLVVLALDYALTCVTAIAFRRPRLLLYGLVFIALRLVDAVATLRAIPQAWSTRSNGQWVSPARRPT